MNDIPAVLAEALAAPHTHEIITAFADGKTRRFTTRNLASAENFANRERGKIGRDLISRNDDLTAGPIVRVTSVEVRPIAK